MDPQRFDELTRVFGGGGSRRGLLRRCGSSVLALAAAGLAPAAAQARPPKGGGPDACAAYCADQPGARGAQCRQACKSCGSDPSRVCRHLINGSTVFTCCPTGQTCFEVFAGGNQTTGICCESAQQICGTFRDRVCCEVGTVCSDFGLCCASGRACNAECCPTDEGCCYEPGVGERCGQSCLDRDIGDVRCGEGCRHPDFDDPVCGEADPEGNCIPPCPGQVECINSPGLCCDADVGCCVNVAENRYDCGPSCFDEINGYHCGEPGPDGYNCAP